MTDANNVSLFGCTRDRCVFESVDCRAGLDRIRVIVSDLHNLSRRPRDGRKSVDLGSLLESVISMAWCEIKPRAKIVRSYEPEVKVLGNEVRLGQVFLNLLVNAAQSIPIDGKEPQHIHVACRRDDTFAIVEVRDTGRGMTPSQRDRIFEPFFTTKGQLGGTGLAVALLVALAAFLVARWRRAAVWLIITMAGALVLDVGLKYGFHRPRPAPFYGPLPHSYSFPSGHAVFSFCFYAVLAGLVNDRVRSLALRIVIWIVAALLILAIGFSRIYLGVHYASDVIAGYLAAALWVSAMIFLDRLRIHRRELRGGTK